MFLKTVLTDAGRGVKVIHYQATEIWWCGPPTTYR